MHRGDIVIVAQRGVCEGKPWPAVIIQNEDLVGEHPSILVCLLTAAAETAGEAFYRIPVEANSHNGLNTSSIIQVDKIAAIRRQNIHRVVGRLDEAILGRLDTALALFQGLI